MTSITEIATTMEETRPFTQMRQREGRRQCIRQKFDLGNDWIAGRNEGDRIWWLSGWAAVGPADWLIASEYGAEARYK